MPRAIFLPLGIAFGFLLSRAGATTYDFYAQLFLLKDLQLLWVICAAIGVGLVGNQLLKRTRTRSVVGQVPLVFDGRAFRRGTIPGSLLFGVGWGVAGACPGTALAMLGEGKLGALFSIAGLIMGTYLYGRLSPQPRSG